MGDIYDGMGHLFMILVIAVIASIVMAIIDPEMAVETEPEPVPVPVVEYWNDETGERIPDSEVERIYRAGNGRSYIDVTFVDEETGETYTKAVMVFTTVRDMTDEDLKGGAH